MNTRAVDRLLGRLLGFLQRHPAALDAAVAVVFAVIGFLSWPGASLESAPQAAYGVIVAASGIALALRRVAPRTALAVLGVCMTAHVVLLPAGVTAAAVMACSIAAYSTQTQLSPPHRWYYLAWIYAGAAAMPLLTGQTVGGDPAIWTRLTVAASSWVFLTTMVLAGAIRRNRRDRVELALERVQLLEAQQETERRLAASEERALIAREVHDVLGHSLTVIAMQAEGIRHVVRRDPDRADAALADLARLSRSAVDEVRGVIDVLRDGDDPAPLVPAPSIAELGALVDRHRAAGVHVALRVGEGLDACSDATGFAVYRIVQESLTNAIRHAPGAAIRVEVYRDEEAVEVVVVNAASTSAPTSSANPEAPGHGLVGMSERARALEGCLEAGPDPLTGGWTVRARLPRSTT